MQSSMRNFPIVEWETFLAHLSIEHFQVALLTCQSSSETECAVMGISIMQNVIGMVGIVSRSTISLSNG